MREPEMTQELQAELHQGVLVRFFGGFYVAADADGQEYTLRCPKKFRHQRLSPLVGDAVRFTPGQGEEEGWLVEILPRKTECIRPPVANVTLLLVSICPSPEPDLLLVDRLLARAKKQGMKTALIVGKCDLDGGKLPGAGCQRAEQGRAGQRSGADARGGLLLSGGAERRGQIDAAERAA